MRRAFVGFPTFASETVYCGAKWFVLAGFGVGPAAPVSWSSTSRLRRLWASNSRLACSPVSSLARPGGNITGLSLQQSDIVGKKLELLREALTGLRRLAIMGNAGNPASALEVAEIRKAASRLGLDIISLDIRRAEDIAPAFETANGRADALYVSTDPLVFTNLSRINTLALGARLPTIYNGKEYVEPGGLMSYGPSYPDLFRRAADFVDKILRGAKPADFPVEQPTKFDLVINLTTAKALGLTIPLSVVARADEGIE